MPKVAYSEEDRAHIRTALVAAGLELMARQGIQHTTVEQIYRSVGISRTFFYTFFPTKEDLVVETLYLQQPPPWPGHRSCRSSHRQVPFPLLSCQNQTVP